MTKHVAVLMGGMSSEREVSLITGKAAAEALTQLGYQVTSLDVQHDIAEQLTHIKPDIAFNALHGTYGEDGCIQGLLEILQIPYTHSGVRASAIAMHKALTKQLVALNGVCSPKGMTYTREALLQLGEKGEEPMPRPYVVKPVSEGSSVGVLIVLKESNTQLCEATLTQTDEFLVEEYIPGRELSAAVWDKGPFGVIELAPKSGFYDYTNKYTSGKTEHYMPAPVPKEIYEQAMDIAFQAHQMLGCQGISRSDIRYNAESKNPLYFLEINTHPGMTPLSIVPEVAAYAGISFQELIQYLVQTARCGK